MIGDSKGVQWQHKFYIFIAMEVEPEPTKPKIMLRPAQTLPIRKKVVDTLKNAMVREKPPIK